MSGGPQSCKFPLLANLCVSRCAIEKPPLPSNCVKTMMTCLKVKWHKGVEMRFLSENVAQMMPHLWRGGTLSAVLSCPLVDTTL